MLTITGFNSFVKSNFFALKMEGAEIVMIVTKQTYIDTTWLPDFKTKPAYPVLLAQGY